MQSGETVLSMVFQNGKLASEYLYNSDSRLERINQYDPATGQLLNFVAFDYNNRGYVERRTGHTIGGKATSELVFFNDSNGKPISSELRPLTGADSGKMTIRYRYEYNAEGYISKEAWHDPITDAEDSYRLYFYYPNGTLEHYEYYCTLNPTPEKAWELHYLPAGRPLPQSLYKHKGYDISFSL